MAFNFLSKTLTASPIVFLTAACIWGLDASATTPEELQVQQALALIGTSQSTLMSGTMTGSSNCNSVNSNPLSRTVDANAVISEGQRLRSWLALHSNRYLSHGIWPNNVDKVMASKTLKPAELVFRESGQVSQEEGKSHGSRSNFSVNSQQVKEFFKEIGFIPSCDGISYVKLVKSAESTKLNILIRNHDNSEWKEVPRAADLNQEDIRKFDYDTQDEMQAEISSYYKLVSLFKSKDGQVLNIELPIPNCLGTLGSTLPYLSGKFHFSFYTDKSSANSSRDLYNRLLQFADQHKLPRTLVLRAHDEFWGRKSDGILFRTMDSYHTAMKHFRDTYPYNESKSPEILEDDFENRSGFATHSLPDSRSLRAYYYGDYLPQSDISFAMNGLSNYGNTFVLVGNFLNKKLGIAQKNSGSSGVTLDSTKLEIPGYLDKSRDEVKSGNVIDLNGQFASLDLRDSDVLILGPKKELEKYKAEKDITIIYSDDLTLEEKMALNHLQGGGGFLQAHPLTREIH